jgi:hypothetical protein
LKEPNLLCKCSGPDVERKKLFAAGFAAGGATTLLVVAAMFGILDHRVKTSVRNELFTRFSEIPSPKFPPADKLICLRNR